MASAVTMAASLRLYATIPAKVINCLNLETLAQEDDWPPLEQNASNPDQLASQAISTESLPSALTSSSSGKPTSVPLPKDTQVSFSDTGERIVCSSGRNFLVLAVDMKGSEGNSGRYRLETVGQGSGCIDEAERITAISCIPLFIPSTSRASLSSPEIVAVGYSTGWLRIFTHAGNLLISQLLHRAPLTAIKIRTSTSNEISSNNQNPIYENESDEEVMLLYADGSVVAIEGGSLWMAIRVCDAQRQSTADPDMNNTASFAYKKWTFRQESVSDVVSCGPAKISPSMTPTAAFAPTSPSTLLSTHATARYISVGTNPMLSYHATTETSKPLLSAVSLATMVASATRVTSAVLGFAMSWWGASSSSAGGASNADFPTSSPTTTTENTAVNAVPVALGTPMPSILSLSDPDRRIMRISLAPMSSNAQLAACVDSLGRVMLFDIEEGEMVRMWKGIREGQCAWIDLGHSTLEGIANPKTASRKPTTSGSPKTASSRLFLAVYAPRRGQLEVWHMRYGTRVGAFSVGGGCSLLNVVNGKVGSGMVGGGNSRIQQAVNTNEGCTCFLVGPTGEIWTVNVDLKLDGIAETKATTISVKKNPIVEKPSSLTIKPKSKANDKFAASAFRSTREESVESAENGRKWTKQTDIKSVELPRIEEAWNLSTKWTSNIADVGPIISCIELVQKIEFSSLRCAILVALWARDLSPMFKKVLALVEKARKAPKDAVCVREVGMGVPAIISLLNCLLALFNELEAVTVNLVPGIGPASLLSLLQRSEFNKISAVAGEIKRVLEEDFDAEDALAEQKVIDDTMVLDHKIMLKLLLQIFSSEIRMVRPSRLIRRKDGSVFGGSLFGGGTQSASGISGKSPEQRILQDRENFLMKLIELNPKSEEQWGKIVELAGNLNVPIHGLRSSRAILLFALDDDERAIRMTDGIEPLELKSEIFLYVSKRRLAKFLDDRNPEHARYLWSVSEEVRNWLFDEQNVRSDEVNDSPVATMGTRKTAELLQRAERSWGGGDRKNKVLGGRIQILADLCTRMLSDH